MTSNIYVIQLTVGHEIHIYVCTQAAATTCYVATHPRLENVSGKYFADCNETQPSKSGSNSYQAQRLWTFSEIMAGGNPKSAFHL